MTAVNKGVHFGTDGWRGIIAADYTVENVRRAADALARTFPPKRGTRPTVYVGYDHRFLAENFAYTAADVLRQRGFQAKPLSEAVSSPFISYLTNRRKCPFGVMITASHNPAHYLGFKVKASYGGSISEETAKRIESNVRQHEAAAASFSDSAEIYDPRSEFETYFKYLKSHVDVRFFKKAGLHAVVDSMYGPGGKFVERFLRTIPNRLNVKIIHNSRDAHFGGLHPEPIEPYLGGLKSEVKKSRAAFGFALDGDADRLGAVDEHGRYLTPHQIFAMLLYYLVTVKKLRGKVVQALSLGYLSERIARDHGLPFEEVSVGFKYVAEKLMTDDVLIGGEESGGFAFGKTRSDTQRGSILPERDGVLSMLMFLEMRLATGKSISSFLAEIQSKYGRSCYQRKDVVLSQPVGDKSRFANKIAENFPSKWLGQKVKEIRTFDGVKVILESGAWMLVRPSGTEPLMRLYTEFPDDLSAKKSLAGLAEFVLRR